MTQETFWMLYVSGGNNPTFAHRSYESAAAEAERLAAKTGNEVFILQAVESVKENRFVHTPLIKEDMPF